MLTHPNSPVPSLRLVAALALLACSLATPGFAADDRLAQRRKIAPRYDELKLSIERRLAIPVIVKFTVAAPDGRALAERREAGRRRLRNAMERNNMRSFAEFRRSGMSAYVVATDQLDQLIDSGFVEAVWESRLRKAHLQQSNNLIGSQVARDYGLNGSGAVVVVLDTGIDVDHPAFDDRVVWEACYSTTSGIFGATNLCPDGTQTGAGGGVQRYSQVGPGAAALTKCTAADCWHGTHVASIAAGSDATNTGIAPQADIIAIQIFSHFDSETYCGAGDSPCVLSFDHDQLAALEYVADLDASYDIAAVNMSLGGGSYSTVCDISSSLPTALNALEALDIVVVASSGNDSSSGALSHPACLSQTISVGSVHDTNDTVSSSSNSASFLDLLAPGQPITAADAGGGFVTAVGTSMASPHVAGAVALLKAYDVTLSHPEMTSLLLGNGVPILDTRNGLTFPRLDLGLLTLAVAGGPVGDANHDGNVDITDLFLVQRHMIGMITLAADAIRRCDVYPAGSPDGVLDLSDLLELQRIVVSH